MSAQQSHALVSYRLLDALLALLSFLTAGLLFWAGTALDAAVICLVLGLYTTCLALANPYNTK